MDSRRHSDNTCHGQNSGQQPGRVYQQHPYDPYFQQQQHVRPEDVFRQPQYTYSNANMFSGSYATSRNTTPPGNHDSTYTHQSNRHPSPSRHAIHPENQVHSQHQSRRNTPPDGINARHSPYGTVSGTATPKQSSSGGTTPPGKGKERHRVSDEEVRRRIEAERKGSTGSSGTFGGNRHGPEPDPRTRRSGRGSDKLVSGVFIRY